jgi:hypothetical protein
MAETDAVLAPTEGQSEDAPAEEMPVLGMGLLEEDKADADPAAGSGQTGTDSQIGDDVVSSPESTSSGNEPDDPGLLRKDHTKKTMALADERRDFEAEKSEWRSKQEEWLSQREARAAHQDVPGTPATPAAEMTSQSLALAVQQSQSALANPQLTADQRAAVQQELVALQGLQGWRAELDEFKQFREKVAPLLQQTAQTVSGLTAAQRDVQVEERLGAVKEAQQLFGEDTVRQHGAAIAQHFKADDAGQPILKPGTDQPYTPSELVAMYSGVSLQEAQNARARNRNVRSAAKQNTRPVGAAQVPANVSDAMISRSEAEAEIAATLS